MWNKKLANKENKSVFFLKRTDLCRLHASLNEPQAGPSAWVKHSLF